MHEYTDLVEQRTIRYPTRVLEFCFVERRLIDRKCAAFCQQFEEEAQRLANLGQFATSKVIPLSITLAGSALYATGDQSWEVGPSHAPSAFHLSKCKCFDDSACQSAKFSPPFRCIRRLLARSPRTSMQHSWFLQMTRRGQRHCGAAGEGRAPCAGQRDLRPRQ